MSGGERRDLALLGAPCARLPWGSELGPGGPLWRVTGRDAEASGVGVGTPRVTGASTVLGAQRAWGKSELCSCPAV